MATRRNIEVVITVRDAASKPLSEVENKLRKTGKAAKDASADFVQFNKTLFTTTAFIGTFLKAFGAMKNSLDLGGDLDRLANQYERVLGPKGQLFDAITSLTTISISRMEAMRASLSLSALGITRDVGQTAEIIAKAGTAAKLAGLDSAEGVQKFTEFLKSGSINSLEFLNLISRTNPALQAQMSILQKAGGVMGTVLTTQAKLSLGMALLNAAVQGNMNQMRDLKDIMITFGDSWDWIRRQIGRFLGAALGPLIDKLSPFLYKLGDAIDKIRRTEKSLVFLAKATILTTGAIVGLLGALGSLSLIVKLLGFAGIGLPGLSTALMILTGLFVGLTDSADSLMERLKLFGAFVQGIWQLITSLDPSTGFAKMDKSVHDMLKKAGLLTLAQNIARIGSIVKTVVEDSVEAFKTFANFLDKTVGGVFKKVKNLLDNFSEAWNIWWVSKSISPVQKFVRTATVILGAFFAFLAGKKIFGLLQTLLGKLPIIGRFFGGGKGPLGGGPKGTSSDPVYVKQAGLGLGDVAAGGSLLGKLGKLLEMPLERLSMFILRALSGIAPAIIGALTVALPVILAAGITYAGATLLNKLSERTNKYGQTSNIMERAFGKMGVWTGQITPEQYEDMYGPAQQPGPNKKTEVSIPIMPDSQVAVVDALGEQMKQLEGDRRAKFKESFESALATGSLGGEMITADEFRDAMVIALDNSENLSVLANKAKEAKSTITPSSRR